MSTPGNAQAPDERNELALPVEDGQNAVALPAPRNQRALVDRQVPVVLAGEAPDALADAVVVPLHQDQDVPLVVRIAVHGEIMHLKRMEMQTVKSVRARILAPAQTAPEGRCL
jgi:hypothetical protein